MGDKGNTAQTKARAGGGQLSPEDVSRLFDDGYRGIEILPDGTLREITGNGGTASDETVTRTLKTERTWY